MRALIYFKIRIMAKQWRLFVLLLLLTYCSGLELQSFTVVTGMWDVGRGNFSTSARGYKTFYLQFFKELLQYKGNMVIFGSEVEYQCMVQNRPKELIESKTVFIKKDLKDFEQYWYTKAVHETIEKMTHTENPIENIKRKNLPQFGIKMYNPVVMSKHRLLMEAARLDFVDSENILWLDGGIAHILPILSHLEGSSFSKLFQYYQPDWFLQTALYGFKPLSVGFKDQGGPYLIPNNQQYIEVLGNFVGGKTSAASTAYHVFQNLLRITLQNEDMNTDEAVFVLMAHRYPYFFKHFSNINLTNLHKMNVKIPKLEPPLRKFEWKQQILSNYKQIQRDEDEAPLMISKLIEVRNVREDYFQREQELFRATVYSRVAFLFLLTLITAVIRRILSKEK